MTETWLILLSAQCLILTGMAIARPQRIYEFPWLIGAVFTVFILPQAFSLYNRPLEATASAVEQTLIMSNLCLLASWVPYRWKSRPLHHPLFSARLSEERLQKIAAVFIIAALILRQRISSMAPETDAAGNWTGSVTIYAFFSGAIYPAFAIMIVLCLRRVTATRVALLLLASFVPLEAIVLWGRRGAALTVFATIGVVLWYERRLVPPRWVLVGALAAATIGSVLIGTYRDIAGRRSWSQLATLDVRGSLAGYIKEEKILELRNAAILIEATRLTGQYALGSCYWDELVFRFVPAQLVGRDFKQALMTGKRDQIREFLLQNQNYDIPIGSTLTGVGDTFFDFGYFGCLVFGLFAWFSHRLWLAVEDASGLVPALLYTQLIPVAIQGVTHNMMGVPASLIYGFGFVVIALLYARVDEPAARAVVRSPAHRKAKSRV